MEGIEQMKTIIELAADYFGVTVEKLRSKDRHEPLGTYRAIASAVAYESTTGSLAAKIFGYAVPSSPLNNAKKVKARACTEPHVERDVENLRRLVAGQPMLDRIEYPRHECNSKGWTFPRPTMCECGRHFVAANRNEYKSGCPKCRELQKYHDYHENRQNSRPWTYVEPYAVCIN